jgi:serine/threonine protein kinase
MISNISKNKYELIDRIGEGTYVTVYKVLYKNNNIYYSLKFFPKKN